MRTLAVALVAAASLTTVAQAEIAGPRIEVVAGYDEIGVDHGFGYGLGLGYDFAVAENLSLGLDVEYARSTQADQYFDYGVLEAEESVEHSLYAGLRLTVALNDALNLVVKGGYSNLKMDYTNYEYDYNDSETMGGLTTGAGIQYNVFGNAYIGAEYRYTKFQEWDMSRHQALGSIGYRF